MAEWTRNGSPLSCTLPGPLVAATQPQFSPHDHVVRARVLAEHEKHEEAITCFEAAIALLTISGDSCDRSQSPSTPPPSAPSENEDMVQAMVGKGISLGKLGRSVAAAQAFDAALELDGNSVEALTYLGLLRIREKRTEEGIELFRRALKREASHKLASESLATALTDEGTRLKLLAQSDDALSNYREAARVCPGYAPAYYNEGIVLAERGMVQQALESYARALKLWPRYFEAHNNRGVLLKGLDRLPEAIEAYRACLEINPNFELAAHNLSLALSDLGTAVKAQGRVQEAIHLYQQALYYNATSADVMYNLGVAYVENKEPLQAAIWYQLTIEVNPRSAEAYNNLGVIYKDMDNFPKALSCYEAALRIRPTFPEALNNMGVVMTILNQPEDALPYFNSALQVAPSYAEAYTNLGKLFQDAGDADKAIYYYEQSVALCPYVENAAHNRLLALNYSDGRSRDSVTAAHLAWGRDIRARALAAATSANSSALDAPENTLCLSRQLRVGYLSPDFNKHSVAYFAEALLRHHSKAHFHITCYSAGAKEDATSRRMRAHADSWVSVVGMPPLTVAQKIRADQIDILVELAGHTAGNRLDVMALRPAPVQVTYIGYPNTTGLETIQYRITDKYVDPPDTTQQFSEELIRLPDCFLCYSPPDECEVPPVSAPPSAALHYVTFGSFNNIAKINGRVVRLWARILLAVPESRLFLKSRAFAAKQVKESCLVAFAQYGVDRSCIDLHQVMPSTGDHLAKYAQMDISLDTFPYAGTTTTVESLLMGVPVVTFRSTGQEATHAQNVGVSLLTQIDCTELIADNEDQFVDIAVNLARSPERIRALRETLRQRLLASPLCDGSRYIVNVENQYRYMWRRYCDEQAKQGKESGKVRDGERAEMQLSAGAKKGEEGEEGRRDMERDGGVADMDREGAGVGTEMDEGGVEGENSSPDPVEHEEAAKRGADEEDGDEGSGGVSGGSERCTRGEAAVKPKVGREMSGARQADASVSPCMYNGAAESHERERGRDSAYDDIEGGDRELGPECGGNGRMEGKKFTRREDRSEDEDNDAEVMEHRGKGREVTEDETPIIRC